MASLNVEVRINPMTTPAIWIFIAAKSLSKIVSGWGISSNISPVSELVTVLTVLPLAVATPYPAPILAKIGPLTTSVIEPLLVIVLIMLVFVEAIAI